jgi:hypothetical protein
MSRSPIPIPAAARDALRRGNKIEAIKIVRETAGSGLKEARDAVEDYLKDRPELAAAVPAEKGAGCGGATALVIAVAGLGEWLGALIVGQ